MDKRVLDFQSDRIEAVLAYHGLSARVTGGLVSPRWIQYKALTGLGTRFSRVVGLADELAGALGARTCRVARNRGQVLIEVPRADPQPVRLLPLLARLAERDGLPFGSAVLGLADDGAPLLVRLPSPQVAHVLIAGTTGSGKSVLLQTIVASLALHHQPRQLGFVLIDPKRRACGPLAGLPHLLRPVAVEPEQAALLLAQLVGLMEQRDRDGLRPWRSDELGEQGEARVIVVIDELMDLLLTAPQAETALVRLVQRGREAGIHVIAATQKPTAAVIGSLMKANFPVRLVGQVTSPEDAKVAAGYAGSGAERLQGPGDFIAVSGGQMTRFQAAYATPGEIVEAIARRWPGFVTSASSVEPSRPRVVDLPAPTLLAVPVLDSELARRVELARPVWAENWDIEAGGLRWGGRGRIAAAIFQDGSTSTAGHRHQAVVDVCTVLEGELLKSDSVKTTTWREVFLRPPGADRAFSVGVVGIADGQIRLGGR